MTILANDGPGFIGSIFMLDWLSLYNEHVLNLYKLLIYAGNLENLANLQGYIGEVYCRLSKDDLPFAEITDYCAPEHERHIAWDYPMMRIHWPIDETPKLSSNDLQVKLLAQAWVFE